MNGMESMNHLAIRAALGQHKTVKAFIQLGPSGKDEGLDNRKQWSPHPCEPRGGASPGGPIGGSIGGPIGGARVANRS